MNNSFASEDEARREAEALALREAVRLYETAASVAERLRRELDLSDDLTVEYDTRSILDA